MLGISVCFSFIIGSPFVDDSHKENNLLAINETFESTLSEDSNPQ